MWPSNQRPWTELVERARFAEDHGWYGLWYADHLMPNTPDNQPSDGDALECWTVLAALAPLTARIRLGSLVSPVTLHHPVVLAKRAATVAHLAGERAVLGLGAGWQVNEHAAYGFELPAPGERVDRFAEALEVVVSLREGGRANAGGRTFRVDDAPFAPAPALLPVLIGTASPRMLRLTARHADEWNTWGSPELYRQRRELFHRACERERVDPADVWTSAQALVTITDDRAAARRLNEEQPGRALAGSPEQLAEALRGYAEMGLDEFIVCDFHLDGSDQARREFFERFDDEVIPLV